MTTTTTDTTAPRHWPALVPVHGGWRAGCSCGWQHPTTLPTERRARRLAWEHIATATRDTHSHADDKGEQQ